MTTLGAWVRNAATGCAVVVLVAVVTTSPLPSTSALNRP